MTTRILIVKIGALGDVLRTTFLLPLLKKKYADCSITWVTARAALPLLQHNTLIDHLYSIDDTSSLDTYDLVLSLDDEKEPATLAQKHCTGKLIGAYPKEDIITYSEDSSPWFGMGLLRPESLGGLSKANDLKAANTKTYFDLIAQIVGVSYNGEKPLYTLSESDKAFQQTFITTHSIDTSKKIIGINTGSGARWPSKRWSIEHTADLINDLTKTHTVILLGGADEKERNQKIKSLCSDVIDSGSENSLTEFASIIDLCNLLVCSDTLALHFATALHKTVIVLIGSTSASEIDVFKNGAKLTPTRTSCGCFYKKECSENPPCIDTITTTRVLENIQEHLNEP